MNRAGSSPYTAALLLLVMVSIAIAILGWYSYQLAERGRAGAALQQRALDEARIRFQRSGDERALLIRYAPEYRALAGHGFIGAEQRVQWIDSLRLANQTTQLFGVQYQIGAQARYLLPERPDANLYRSPMTINLQLVHEGDLMRFLRALAASRSGVFTIDECTLERIGSLPAAGAPGTSVPTPQVQANLRAECDLSWITAERATGPSAPTGASR